MMEHRRRGIDGLVHVIHDMGNLHYIRTVCRPGIGMRLYEHMANDQPATCVWCIAVRPNDGTR